MLQRLIRQQDYLLDITQALTAKLSLNDVLRSILRSATEMLGGQAGLIALANGETFTLRASYGINPAVLHLFAPLLAGVTHTGAETVVIPEVGRKLQMIAQAAGIPLRQVVALPMAVSGELVGIVFIFREYGGAFSRNDMRVLQSFASQAAIAVHNARLYEQIVAEKQRLDAILRHSGDGIMILTPDHTVESINLALAKMLAVLPESVQGNAHAEVIRWAKRQTSSTLEEAVLNGWPLGEYHDLYVEGDLQRTDGTTLSVGITYAPLFDADGKLRNTVANVRDITRFREAEEAKSIFISIVSHELRTPVSLIKGYADTLRRDDVDWDRAALINGLQIIDEEADRLAELIDNLLDISRMQAGMLPMRFGPVALDRVAKGAVEKFSTQAAAHNITLTAHFPEGFPTIEGDEQRLGQVIRNLLSNAIKYSPEGGNISVEGEGLTNAVRITVSDEGIGMSAEQQAHAFDRFYRADNALTRKTEGAGLGLAIVHSIVEAHHGIITLDSAPGEGTSVTVTMPLSQP
ncbi:MAG: GAF domain-containing protein [Anaerolineae bacterium]|nr:GAF domain-containing protein [Anaerolineae bacterium]